MTDNPFFDKVPSRDELYNPVLSALRALGSSASIRELVEQVIKDLGVPPDIAEIQHVGKGAFSGTEIEYNLAWVRTQLKKVGLVDNSERGVWSLTVSGRETKNVDAQEVNRRIREHYHQTKQPTKQPKTGEGQVETADTEDGYSFLEASPNTELWREELLSTLRNMGPDAFERLCQRLLRESGFIQTKVTGKSGDGGIDGHGIVRLNGLISFPVLFQCKRYTQNVGASEVRDFRGAMTGRTDRGLILTTGGFTRAAYAEASRSGAPPIDLIDSGLLIDKLKELKLGVITVESVEVDTNWFNSV